LGEIKSGILLSGGMDSIALAYWKRPNYSFTIDYGQKAAKAEIQSAIQVSKMLNIQHEIIRVDCSSLGSGDMSNNQELSLAPVTEWWPYRNQLLVTLACMKGIAFGLTDLYIGSVSTDSSHRDGTKGFYERLSNLIEYQEGGITIKYPALNITTVELINKSKVPESVLLWAHSCHTANEPCGMCHGCIKYLVTIKDLGLDE
jgi:7-cyano-7-deazaguanine synthase